MRLHKTPCSHIGHTKSMSMENNSHTGQNKIKVCAKTIDELEEWLIEQEWPAGIPNHPENRCQTCGT